MSTQLTRTISLLYRMQPADIAALSAEILERRKQAWKTAITERARAFGCNKTANSPRLDDLAELKRMSTEDAKSIAATWNKDVERQIELLYAQNPRGNRNYYYKNLEAWAASRAAWKNKSIALNTEQQTRFYAQTRFREMNGLTNMKFVFTDNPPPTCAECVKYAAAGVVSQNYVYKHPSPVHVNCPHEWIEVTKLRIPCNEMWVG